MSGDEADETSDEVWRESQTLEAWLAELEPADGAALRAVADLGGRTGAREFQFSCQYPELPYEQRSWWAMARYEGARLMADGHTSAAQACDALARRMLDGGQCQGCGKLSFVANEDGYRVGGAQQAARAQREGICRWSRGGGARWSRACGDRAPEDSSREKLACAMREVGVIPAEQIAAARSGRYDDFLSDVAAPKFLLVEELRPYGTAAAELIKRVVAGDFDSTAAESKAWAESPEGLETMAMFGVAGGQAGSGGAAGAGGPARNTHRKGRKARRGRKSGR